VRECQGRRQIAAAGRFSSITACTACDTSGSSPCVQKLPPGRIRIAAESLTNPRRDKSGITRNPATLTISLAFSPMVFTENPKVRRNSARAEAGSQSA